MSEEYSDEDYSTRSHGGEQQSSSFQSEHDDRGNNGNRGMDRGHGGGYNNKNEDRRSGRPYPSRDDNRRERGRGGDRNFAFTEEMDVPSDCVGKIIGRAGSNIQGVQLDYNVRVDLDKGRNVVKISGNSEGNVKDAMRHIQDQIDSGGGSGGGGGGNRGFGGGGFSRGGGRGRGYGGGNRDYAGGRDRDREPRPSNNDWRRSEDTGSSHKQQDDDKDE